MDNAVKPLANGSDDNKVLMAGTVTLDLNCRLVISERGLYQKVGSAIVVMLLSELLLYTFVVAIRYG